MEFDDPNDIIYLTLYEGYCNRENFYASTWNDYLIKLDIGIQDIGTNLTYISSGNYKVTNEKKWALARLKYGF